MKEFIDKLISRLNKKARWVAYSAWDRDIGMTHKVVPFSDLREIVNQLAEEYKVSEMPTGWISVSERLPEYTDEYNVTVDVASEFGCYRTVKTLRFERIEGKEPKWVMPQDEVYRVIAWCELPAPYTEGE